MRATIEPFRHRLSIQSSKALVYLSYKYLKLASEQTMSLRLSNGESGGVVAYMYQRRDHGTKAYVAQALQDTNYLDVKGTKSGTSDKVGTHPEVAKFRILQASKISGQGYRSPPGDKIYIQL